jgi:hypothetical protein
MAPGPKCPPSPCMELPMRRGGRNAQAVEPREVLHVSVNKVRLTLPLKPCSSTQRKGGREADSPQNKADWKGADRMNGASRECARPSEADGKCVVCTSTEYQMQP